MSFPDGWTGYWEVTFSASAISAAPGIAYLPLSDAPSGWWDALDAAGDTDGDTIRVSDESDTLIPSWVVPTLNLGTRTGALIVFGGGISTSVDTVYRVWCGGTASAPAVTDPEGRNAVFAGYAGFYFLGVTLDDLTGNGRDLTAEGSPGTAAWLEGIPAATYNGSTQYHSYSGTQAVTAWPMSLEAIGYTSSSTTRQVLAACSSTANNNNIMLVGFDGVTTGDPAEALIRGGTSTAQSLLSTTGYVTTTYHHVAATENATNNSGHIYLDGGSSSNSTTTISSSFSPNIFAIGVLARATNSLFLNGRVAAAYLSDSVRSADYVATMQAMWTGSIHTSGEWVEAGGGGCTSGTTGWVLLQSAISSGTGEVWTNPANVLVDDATYALADNVEGYVGVTQALVVTDPLYGVTIPSGADSYQASLRIKRSAESGSRRIGADGNVRFVVGGSPTGSNMANPNEAWPNSPGTMDYGPVPFYHSDFDEDFGFQLVAIADDRDDTDLFVYTAWVKIDWECSGGGSTGTGAITAPIAVVSGGGSQTNDGSGAVLAPVAAVSGSGVASKSGAGALAAAAATLSGAGITGKTGTGAISAPASVLSGSGIQTITGTGALTGYVGEVDGEGTSTTPIFGTGSIESPMPSVSGDGEIQSGNQDLNGALTVSVGVIQGAGITSKTGTAALVAPKPVVAGSGKSTISGAGALTAPDGYVVAGSGLLSPPDAVGTAALAAPAATLSGAGFVLGSSALAVDSVAWHLTGASAAGKSQRDQSLSLGGFRSGVPLRSMTWDCRQPMVGVEILGVGALNGRGTGSLEAITDDSLRWTPPGGVAGTAIALTQGQEAKLFGFESGAWIQVRRNSTLPMVGIHSVQCVDIYNNAIGFDNVASADAVAGETFYRAVMGKNEFDGPMTDIKIWLDADANTGTAIGYEVAVGEEIQTIVDETTAPTGITWVTGTTSTTGISIPSVAAGESFGLWIRKTIAADSNPSPSELVHIHVQYSDLVPTTRLDDLRGKYRIARTDYETYGLWLGQDAQPDLDAAADEEFTSRPHTTSLSLDPDHIYYAVVRWRNKWGLWSQNMTAKALPMLADGEQGFVPPHGPSATAITQSGDNYPIFSARYEPSQDTVLADLTRNDPGRAEIFVLWYTRDDSAPDSMGTPSAYGLMGTRAGVETLKYTATGTAFLDETPVKALVRTRRLAIGAGQAFSPDTAQLPASGAGTIVVDSELTGWESTGYLKVTTFSGALQEVVEYSNLVIGSGISTFTVGSGGRGLWGTTAAATVANNVIYPVTPVDSENTEVTEYTIDGIAPGRPWGDLLFGTDAAQEQEPIEGPDGATEEYISVPNDHYLILGEGWCELWMGSDLVWKVFQDGSASESNGLYIPSEWTVATGAISGASTGVFDSVSANSLYIVAGLVRRVHINASAMTITMPSFSSLGGLPEVAPQSSTWEQYAGTLLQSWDPERQDYRPYAQLTTAGLLTSQWTVYNDLSQAEIMAL